MMVFAAVMEGVFHDWGDLPRGDAWLGPETLFIWVADLGVGDAVRRGVRWMLLHRPGT
jgi:hypothetical protein